MKGKINFSRNFILLNVSILLLLLHVINVNIMTFYIDNFAFINKLLKSDAQLNTQHQPHFRYTQAQYGQWLT